MLMDGNVKGSASAHGQSRRAAVRVVYKERVDGMAFDHRINSAGAKIINQAVAKCC